MRTLKKTAIISAIIFLLVFLLWKSQILALLPFPIKTWKLPSISKAIAFSSDGTMLATGAGKAKSYNITSYNSIGGQSSTVEIRNVSNGSVIQTLNFPAATSLAFSPDNKFIATGNYGGEIKIWTVSDRQLIQTFDKSNFSNDPVRYLSFTPDGQTLVSFSKKIAMEKDDTNQFGIWNIDREDNHYTLAKFISCATNSPDGKLLAIGGRNHIGQREALSIFQLNNGTLLKRLGEKQFNCLDLHFSKDSKLLIFTGSNMNNNTNIYRVADGKFINSITTTKDTGRFFINDSIDATLSPKDQYLAISYDVRSFGGDVLFPKIYKAFFGRIRIWNLENGKLVYTFLNSKQGSNAIAFSPDGKFIASAEKDKTIRLWTIPSNNLRWLWLLSAGGLMALVYWRRKDLKNWIN